MVSYLKVMSLSQRWYHISKSCQCLRVGILSQSHVNISGMVSYVIVSEMVSYHKIMSLSQRWYPITAMSLSQRWVSHLKIMSLSQRWYPISKWRNCIRKCSLKSLPKWRYIISSYVTALEVVSYLKSCHCLRDGILSQVMSLPQRYYLISVMSLSQRWYLISKSCHCLRDGALSQSSHCIRDGALSQSHVTASEMVPDLSHVTASEKAPYLK